MGGGGVDGAIHRAGGPCHPRRVPQDRRARWPSASRRSVQTTGGKLHAAFVIHTVGPIWHDGMAGRERHPGQCLPQLAAAGRPAWIALRGLSRPSPPECTATRPRLRQPWPCAPSSTSCSGKARNVHEVRFVLYSPEMLSVFIQAAKDEQRRRNASRWSFATIHSTQSFLPNT
jgi:hypothetical protein